MHYWLMKSEPQVYSISDLQREQQTVWDGVRNYQARNFLRQMQVGDCAFFYHSNTKPPGIVGAMKIIQSNIADPTQFDSKSESYDPKSTVDSPRWQTVKVEFVEAFAKMIERSTLKQKFSGDELLVVKRGNRLSVMPVAEAIAQQILAIARSQSSVPYSQRTS
ncbi:MAG: EVE domain-containing protein [Cyanophyceae cyanobacterium]